MGSQKAWHNLETEQLSVKLVPTWHFIYVDSGWFSITLGATFFRVQPIKQVKEMGKLFYCWTPCFRGIILVSLGQMVPPTGQKRGAMEATCWLLWGSKVWAMTDECLPGTVTGGTKRTKPPSLPLQHSGCLGGTLKRGGYNFFQWLLGKSNFRGWGSIGGSMLKVIQQGWLREDKSWTVFQK